MGPSNDMPPAENFSALTFDVKANKQIKIFIECFIESVFSYLTFGLRLANIFYNVAKISWGKGFFKSRRH